MEVAGTKLVKGTRYTVVAGPADRALGIQRQVSGVMYRGTVKLRGVIYLVFEGDVFFSLVEPSDVREVTVKKRRYEL